jgi:hypothetical protein
VTLFMVWTGSLTLNTVSASTRATMAEVLHGAPASCSRSGVGVAALPPPLATTGSPRWRSSTAATPCSSARRVVSTGREGIQQQAGPLPRVATVLDGREWGREKEPVGMGSRGVPPDFGGEVWRTAGEMNNSKNPICWRKWGDRDTAGDGLRIANLHPYLKPWVGVKRRALLGRRRRR